MRHNICIRIGWAVKLTPDVEVLRGGSKEMDDVKQFSTEKVDELLTYIDSLKSRLDLYKEVLEKQATVPESTVDKLSQYCDIVTKQRLLAIDLKTHLENNEWLEVSRNVQLIRGLASMIRDDVKALLAGRIHVTLTPKERELLN